MPETTACQPTRPLSPPARPTSAPRFADELLAGHEGKRAEFETAGETDLSHARDGLGRFRVNIFRQRGSISIVLRVVPFKVLSIEDPIELLHIDRGR